MGKFNPTVEQLRSVFSYNPETGNIHSVATGKKVGSKRTDGYVTLKFSGRTLYAHRVAWCLITGNVPFGTIDHINGHRDDNRCENLREISKADNNRNIRQAKRTSRSGLLGVSWHKASKKWRAQLRMNHATIHIGYFASADEAHAAYIVRKRELHSTCTI